MYKRIPALLAALLVLLALAVPVCAQELPDPQMTGSLTLWMAFDGNPLDGGSLTLYRVGELSISDGNAGFSLVEALSDGPELSNLDTPNLARTLAELAQRRSLPPLTTQIEKGSAAFFPLTPGLYVVTQSRSQATEGFDAIQPFLISLPRWEDGTYVYDLTASPKVPLVPAETTPSEPTPPTEPPTPNPPSPDLPQTGQLNWPVPVLAVLGMSFFVAGWSLSRGSGRRSHET